MKPRQHFELMLILGALAALGPFSIDMYLPGFEAIARDFRTDISSVGLSLTSYFAGICIGQIFVGPLIDRYGRRTPMLAGLALFAVAAMGCMLSPGLYWLVALRVLLALGACVGMVASRAIVRDLYSPEQMPKVFSTLMLVMGAAPIIAPTAGSLFSSTIGWRAIFGFLTLFSLALMATVYLRLPDSRPADPSVSLQPAEVTQDYKIVLRHPEFASYALAGGLSMAGLFAYVSGAPLLFMKVLGLSDIQFAWLFGMNALGFIGAAQLNHVILRYITPQRLILTSAIIAATVGTALTTASMLQWTSIPLFATLIFIYMACLGPLIPNTTALALSPFNRFAGSASALIGSLQMLIAALASGAVSTLANGTSLPMTATMLFCAGVSLIVMTWKTMTPPAPAYAMGSI